MNEAEYELAPYASWAPLPDGMIAGVGTWYGLARGQTAAEVRDGLTVAPGRLSMTGSGRPVLERLSQHGVLRAAGLPPCPSYLGAAAAEVGESPEELARQAAERAAPRRITIVGNGGLAQAVTEILRAELAGHDVPVVGGPPAGPAPGHEFAVVVAAAGTASELAQLDRRRRESRDPWLLVPAWAASPAIVGPLFVPPETGCLECYWTRRSARSRHPAQYRELIRGGRSCEPRGWHRHMIAGLAAALALGWVLTADRWLVGACFELSLTEGPVIRRHEFAPVPGCPHCRDDQLATGPADRREHADAGA